MSTTSCYICKIYTKSYNELVCKDCSRKDPYNSKKDLFQYKIEDPEYLYCIPYQLKIFVSLEEANKYNKNNNRNDEILRMKVVNEIM